MPHSLEKRTSLITLKSSYMLAHFAFMSCQILMGSINRTSLLFSAPCNEPQSSFRSIAILSEESESLENRDKSSSIIIGPSLWSSVPWIDMPSCQYDLIWEITSLNFKDKIIGVAVVNKFVFKRKLNNYFLTSFLHSLEHFGIFNCDCCCRDFWLSWVIFLHPCMNWVYAFWCYWSNEHCNCSIFGCSWSSRDSEVKRIVVIFPGMIEADYLSWNLVFLSFKFIIIFENNDLCLDVSKLLQDYPEIELPSPMTPNFCGKGLGSYKVSDYSPLTHLVKFLTSSNLRLSKPILLA